ncbi:MAG: photosystem II S4 domain protein [Cyanobacteria bacterium QS_8_64_29]|nr:MAG: photosystem II S4 domain protein [Cyanobacteria bacterium QS_8_64_29]
MLPREELLHGSQWPDSLAQALDGAERALKIWEVSVTDFLSPPACAEIQQRLERLSDIQTLARGGFAQAERQRLGIARAQVPLDAAQVPLAALDLGGNFLFDTATHRDFLEAILGAGVAREQVGDILVLGEGGAQVVLAPEGVPVLEAELGYVRSVPVKVRPIGLDELKVRPLQTKELTAVEPSLRLDAVASAGFGLSRRKTAAAIERGEVRLNWREVTQPSQAVSPGDAIALQGKGRVVVGEVSTTKKGRYRIALTRYR